MLPFTTEEFMAVFSAYGYAIWPLQIVAYVAAVIAIAALVRQHSYADAVILGVLASMWAVSGLGYHLAFFTRINNAAYLFAALFVLQAAALLVATRTRLKFGRRGGLSGLVGVALILYAALLYPLIGLATGHAYLAQPAFGVTPCPVTLFTFGLLLLTVSPVPRWLLVIPVAWSVIGGTAAFLLQVPQDWILLFSGATAVLIMYFRDEPVETADRFTTRA